MRTGNERIKCAKITMKRRGDRRGLFCCNKTALKAYVFIEAYNDIHRQSKNELGFLNNKIKGIENEIEKINISLGYSDKSETVTLVKEKEMNENILILVGFDYEDEMENYSFLSELGVHLERYRRNKKWADIVKLAETVRFEGSTSNGFTSDLSAMLSGELRSAYEKNRDNKLSRDKHRQEILSQQHAERAAKSLKTLYTSNN